jgi:hypothetical protein
MSKGIQQKRAIYIKNVSNFQLTYVQYVGIWTHLKGHFFLDFFHSIFSTFENDVNTRFFSLLDHLKMRLLTFLFAVCLIFVVAVSNANADPEPAANPDPFLFGFGRGREGGGFRRRFGGFGGYGGFRRGGFGREGGGFRGGFYGWSVISTAATTTALTATAPTRARARERATATANQTWAVTHQEEFSSKSFVCVHQ